MKRHNKHGAIDALFVVALCLVVIGAGFIFWRVSETDKTIQSADIASEQTEPIPAENIDEQKITEDEFTITLSEGWERTGKVSEGVYEYEKDAANLQIHTTIAGREYPYDILWFFTVNDQRSVDNVYDLDMRFCEEGVFSCTKGDSSLTIHARQVLSFSDERPVPRPESPVAIIRATVEGTEIINKDTIDEFKKMILSVQFTSN